MGLHLYCITAAEHASLPPGGVQGVEDAPVRSVAYGALAALVSEHGARPAASLAAIRVHNQVVAGAMDDRCTPVPIRFGQWLDDDAAVRAALRTDETRWNALLRRFAGCAEFAIRIFDPDQRVQAAQPRPGTGREYMAALAARRTGPAARQAEATAPLRDALRDVAAAEVVEPLRTPHGVASVAYLVHRAQFDAYHTALERVRTSLPHFRYLSTGPWPPYSFVTE